ncbi:DUF1761 domain-containing protein [Candidatus Daviesbacteria bacterium]|nr:DUF1761 domain-containing protein [Candidatus Daviesbacteria bacterium]
MLPSSINLLAVFLAGVAYMVVGFLWYSPMLFGKKWMKLMGISAEDMKKAQKSMVKMYGIAFITGLVMAYILGVFINLTPLASTTDGLQVAFWAWLGFVATVGVTSVIFAKKPLMLFYIDSAYQLAGMLVMSLVLTMWP